jgi:hypothetical protein
MKVVLRNAAMRLDNFTCVYCGYYGDDVTVDHFIPVIKGGPNVIDNLYTCCLACNTKKGDRPIWQVEMTLGYGRFSRDGRPARLPRRRRGPLTTMERMTIAQNEDLAPDIAQVKQWLREDPRISAREVARRLYGDGNERHNQRASQLMQAAKLG